MTAKNCPPAQAKRRPTLSPRQLALIWEVYARIGLRPEQAVHLLRRQRVNVTPKQAQYHLAQAAERNLLRLVHFS